MHSHHTEKTPQIHLGELYPQRRPKATGQPGIPSTPHTLHTQTHTYNIISQCPSQGINVLYEATKQRINSNMASFEEFAKLYAFYIPKGLPQQPATSIPADAADGAAVQAAMAELINTRRQLLAVRSAIAVV